MDKGDRKPQYGEERQRFGGDRSQRFAVNRKKQAYNPYGKDEVKGGRNKTQ